MFCSIKLATGFLLKELSMKNLKELVSIQSFDTQQNKQIIDYLVKKFSPYSEEILRLKNTIDERENLLIGLNTKLNNVKNAIILAGHIDTVVADEQLYNTDPYTPTIIGDKMYGLGTIDMKSFFACLLDNIEQLKRTNYPIIIAITGDEETTLNGVNIIKKLLLERNVTPKISIIGEPTDLNICYASKGCNEYLVEATGKSCHSSMPNNGINANYIIARIMLYIEKLCSKIPGTTLTANVVTGGDKINIISDKANLKFDLRSDNVKNSQKIMTCLKKYIKGLEKKYVGSKIMITQTLDIPPLEDKNNLLIDKLCAEFKLCKNSFLGGCEAGYYQSIGGDAIVFGVGQLSLAHKPNEYVNLCEYEQYKKLLVEIIEYLGK